jgi:chemotaxis protein CheX
VPPKTAWPVILRETAVEVLSTMAGLAVTSCENGTVPVAAQITGMVGIAGPLSATFSLQCSSEAATFIASKMLDVPAEEAAVQKCDAIGEICNMVAGYFKAKIGLGDACQLSVPTVLAGTNYQIRSRKDDELMELPLLHKREPIWIRLQIRP